MPPFIAILRSTYITICTVKKQIWITICITKVVYLALFYNFYSNVHIQKMHNGGTAGDLVSKNGILQSKVNVLPKINI